MKEINAKKSERAGPPLPSGVSRQPGVCRSGGLARWSRWRDRRCAIDRAGMRGRVGAGTDERIASLRMLPDKLTARTRGWCRGIGSVSADRETDQAWAHGARLR